MSTPIISEPKTPSTQGIDPSALAPELKALVRETIALLGQVIRREQGEAVYLHIEGLRQQMASLRELTDEEAYGVLKKTLRSLRKLRETPTGDKEFFAITHSFTLMLELMNTCENAYRTFRIRGRKTPELKRTPEAIVYVLTAHPTEARSPESIALFRQIQTDLVLALETDFERQREKILHAIEIVWRVSLSRMKKPTVADEAEHIYSIALRDEVLSALLKVSADTCPVYLRSWVGGDKEGHPGVNDQVMSTSLQLSRGYLHHYLKIRIKEVSHTLSLLPATPSRGRLQLLGQSVEKDIAGLKKLQARDGDRILKFKKNFKSWWHAYETEFGSLHPAFVQANQLLKLFPALVVPLELREASDVIMSESGQKPLVRMLKRLKTFAGSANPKGYARGLVISMASQLEHIEAACQLQEMIFGHAKLPVIPLFEQQTALEHSHEVIAHLLDRPKMRNLVEHHWDGHLEVMVGYSDSAKEMGVLPSRLMISEAIERLDRICQEKKITPVFFHGSGGSVDRGGGSIQEQTAWWPRSALNFYKATIQGEMVDRTLSSPEIAESLLLKIAGRVDEAFTEGAAPLKVLSEPDPRIVKFSEEVRAHYQAKVQSPDFMELVQQATAYRYLSELKIGSRPAKRKTSATGALSVASLRAIPWVLCWTQTRILFPTWWGVGSAWNKLEPTEKKQLIHSFHKDPLLSSYVKALGFTLAKVELPIWRLYLETSSIEAQRAHLAYLEFEREYLNAVAFVQAVSGSENLLSFRPWLGESVRLRSPLIHPLNLIQMILLENPQKKRTPIESHLIRETVTGIASGLMTTG